MNTRPDNVVPKYLQVQQQFARYIRDPDTNTVPTGVEPRRMAIYKRLFFNNLSSFCAKTFKSFRPFVEDTEWNSLIRGFMREYSCTSPYFKDIPLMFVEYLNQVSDQEQVKFPFMREMCHLDAIRMQLRLAPDAPQCERLDINEYATCLGISSTVRLLSYEWPVQKLTPATWIHEKPKHPTWLIAFRDRSDQVDLLTTNAHTFRMLEVLEAPMLLKELSFTLSSEFKISESVLIEQLLPTLQVFNKKGIVLTMVRQ